MISDKYIFSDCGSSSNKAVKILASVCSYKFIEHCLYKDAETNNEFTILNAENLGDSYRQVNLIEGEKMISRLPSELAVMEIRGTVVLDASIPLPANVKFSRATQPIPPAELKYKNIYEFLGFSPDEAKSFSKWYARRVKPYCRNNGIDTNDYPISPPLLLEIGKLDTDIEEVITYFENYCSVYRGHIDMDLLNSVAEIYKKKSTALDDKIVASIITDFPDKVAEYKAGKTNLINLFFGEYIKRLTDKSIDKGKLKEELTAHFANMN